jgi:nitroimidazol reductase NimA-like FMN-containing flavoprotein (pyridoxamine 5'-phosphate oxidase superfamily)
VAEPNQSPLSVDSPEVGGQVGAVSEEECLRRLKSTPIGRLGFISDGQPMVLPVNYAWVDGCAVFRTAEGQKMASVVGGQAVCFEVDRWDVEARTGWSVVVKGTADEVTDWAEKETLEQLGLVPWHQAGWRPIWIKVTPTEISGRAVC